MFDSLTEYEEFRESGNNILPFASDKAKAEAAEEAGMAVRAVKLYKKSTLGATV